MSRLFFAITFMFVSVSAAMSSTADPTAAVHEYVADFNKGDVKAMAATCANPASILDGLPPHAWQGPTACEEWYRDVMAEGEHEGATGYVVSLGKPRHVNVTGDRAYVVVPATMFRSSCVASRLGRLVPPLPSPSASSQKGGA
jgi:ketosteroid isomerase-like protein